MRLILPFLWGRKAAVARLAGNGLVQAGGNILISLFIRHVFDQFVMTQGPAAIELSLIAGALAALILIRALAVYDERTRSERLGQEFAHEIRLKLFRRLKNVPPRDLRQRARGSMTLRLANDVTPLRQWVTFGVARLTVATISISATLAALALIDWRMGLLVAAALGTGTAISLLFGRPLENILRESRRRRAYLANNMSEKISTMATIQAHGQISRESKHLTRQSQRVVDSMVRRARYIGALRSISEGTMGLATITALIFGASQAAAGNLSAGTVVAAMSIVGLLAAPLRDFERIYEYWSGAQVARRKIEQLLQLPTLSRPLTHEEIMPSDGRLVIDNISITGILDGFSARARAGEKIALMGPAGSGKSTLLMAIAGLVEPTSGTIMIGHADIRHLRRKRLHRVVGIMSHEFPLLSGTIRKNLTYRKPRASDAEIAQAAALAGLDQFIDHLPDGLDTRLSEGGGNLSSGERQRLAFARAILGTPPLLLIDATDMHPDPDMTRRLHGVMTDYSGTVLLITHDTELAARASHRWTIANIKTAVSQTAFPQPLTGAA